MRQSITDRLALFVNNSQAATREFRWWTGASGQCRRLMSLIYTLEDKPLDLDAVKESHKIVRSNTRWFSKFRGLNSFFLAAKLSLDDNPEQLFADTLEAYDRIREARLNNIVNLAVAAFLMASSTERHNFKNIANRAKKLQDGMKIRGWVLTGQDNSIFSTMIALTDMIPSVVVERVEQISEQLRPEFKGLANASVQALAQVLVLGEKSDEALNCIPKLNKALRNQGIRLDSELTLPMLGIFSLLSVDDAIFVSDILAAQDYLRQQRGFRSLPSQELLLLSVAIISSVYVEEMTEKVNASKAASVVNIIIAQQIVIMIVTIAAIATATPLY